MLITSQVRREAALAALKECPRITLCVVVDGPGDGAIAVNLSEVTSGFSDTPIADETLGIAMLYSSGITGRPKGILRRVPDELRAADLIFQVAERETLGGVGASLSTNFGRTL